MSPSRWKNLAVLDSTVAARGGLQLGILIEARGLLFIGLGEEVYPGIIIGAHSRESELAVNPTKGKNSPTCGLQVGTERSNSPHPYIKDGEKLEVTPKKVRLRKA